MTRGTLFTPYWILLATVAWTPFAAAGTPPKPPAEALWDSILACSGDEFEGVERRAARVAPLLSAPPTKVMLVEAGTKSLIVSLAPEQPESDRQAPEGVWSDERYEGSGYCSAYEASLPARGRGRARKYLVNFGPVHVAVFSPLAGWSKDGYPFLTVLFEEQSGRPVAAIADSQAYAATGPRHAVSKEQPSLEMRGSESCGCGPSGSSVTLYHDFGQGLVAILGVDRGPGGDECVEDAGGDDEEGGAEEGGPKDDGCVPTWVSPGKFRILGLGRALTIDPIDYDCESMPERGKSWRTTWIFDAAVNRFRREKRSRIPFVAYRPCPP